MSLPTSLRAYEDCRDLFERAVADPKGARACLGTRENCMQMRVRMHYFRKLDRQANAETYPSDHPSHGQSVYDEYVIQIVADTEGEYWLYVQPRSSKILAIEGLSEVENLLEIEATEVLAIENQSNG